MESPAVAQINPQRGRRRLELLNCSTWNVRAFWPEAAPRNGPTEMFHVERGPRLRAPGSPPWSWPERTSAR